MEIETATTTCPDSVWCIVGNVVEERPYGHGGEDSRRSTRLFRPNAKVYLASLRNSWALFYETDDAKWYHVEVVGQHRKSRAWIKSFVRFDHLTHWRIQVVYKPGAVQRLWDSEWPGFNVSVDGFSYDEHRDSQNAVESLLYAIRAKIETAPQKPWWRFW